MLGVSLASTFFAICIAGVIGDRMLLDAEDARLRAASLLLIHEAGKLPEAQARLESEEEVREMAPAGIQVALFEGDRHLGGAIDLAPLLGCRWAPARANFRLCGVAEGSRVAVAGAQLDAFIRLRRGLLVATLAAALAAIALSVLVSRRVARWAARPLTELTDVLARVKPGEEAVHLAASGYAEVDAVWSALSDALSRLAGALGQSKRFAANAAHELRTPLATLRAELELQQEVSQPPRTAAALTRLHATVCSLSVLVDRLLALAESDGGVLGSVRPVALREVTEDVLRSLPPDSRARVQLDAPADALVSGDAQLLRQLVENAVDNALKFSGTRPVKVWLSETDAAVVMDVADEGPGISEEDLPRVFEPFFRSNRARSEAAGHGLGLSVVALVVRAHAGAVQFLPDQRGATLRVTLPRATERGTGLG